MSIVLIVILVVGVVAALAVAVYRRSQQPEDGVATFRRHIDALSPQARREVIDRVQHARDSGKGK